MNRKIKIYLLVIVALGGFIRFWSLGDNHMGFFRDEAALGFNAWSILHTGKDEYGQSAPAVFRSFEVFFMPAYVYLSVPVMAAFGLNEFSARFLSALSGTFLIVISFLIAKTYFSSNRAALLVATIVSFSPWAIFYSRGAFEGNLALLFFATGFYFWIKFQNTNQVRYFFVSLGIFVLSMYSYQSPKLVAPLFLGISILTIAGWWKMYKLWILGALFALILYTPILLLTFQPAGYHRALGVSIFSGNQPIPGDSILREFLSLYLQYFSPRNLFWSGDYNNQRSVEGFSTFYFWLLPALLLGLVNYLRNNFICKKNLLIWLLVAPIPASFTLDPFHTYRAILIFIPIALLIGLGIDEVLKSIKRFKGYSVLVFILLLGFSTAYYLFNFFYVNPIYRWRDWDFGYKEITDFVKLQPNDTKVVIDDKNTESYIHLLFYQVVAVLEYQKQASTLIGNSYYSLSDELRPQKVGRFEFRKVDLHAERENENTLFIISANQIHPVQFSPDPNLNLKKIINAPDGNPAFYLIKVI